MVDRKVVRMDRLEEEHVVDLDIGLLVPFYPTLLLLHPLLVVVAQVAFAFA
ncbi:hypothetical protein PIB30_112603 [Stylosanthes scabra]|uniref:Uncharacterized protein n=1 Tax=Stylosanthes scabra TaxID=79078 RepID=A0ABU6R061_9FABA|nr:hypothetical protein [Stylosanthes scabra]